MRIAFITFEYPPFVQGGAGSYAKNLVREISKENHEIVVIAPKMSDNKIMSVENGVTIYRLPIINTPFLRYLSFLVSLRVNYKNIIKQVGEFDIIHANQSTDFSLTNNLIGIPRVVTVHSLTSTNVNAEKPNVFKRVIEKGENNYFSQYVEKKVLKRADVIIANSTYTKESIFSAYKFHNSKVRVIYNGIFIKPCKFKNEELKINMGLGDDQIILFVGRLVHRKGLTFLLNAFEVLMDKGSKIKLIVVGTGAEVHKYTHHVKKMGIEKNVVFMGYVDDMTLKKLYCLSDVVAIPSLNEPFGIVVLEAMQAKKPIVASNSGAIPELIQDRINGRLIDPQDSLEFAEAIELYIGNKELSEKVGRLNYDKVVENFTWTKTAEQTCKIYEMLLKKNQSEQ